MQKSYVSIDRDWGIDLIERKMKYQPYPVDNGYCYIKPSEDEIAEIYEISGLAVSETLLYFEELKNHIDTEVEKFLSSFSQSILYIIPHNRRNVKLFFNF